MDDERLWISRISEWMENKETDPLEDPAVEKLKEEWRQASFESETFLQTSDRLQKAFSQIVGKVR
jgi:hypothetical protein